MSQFRDIEIDFDVHKMIELERRSFEEPPNTALRRLLGLDSPERATRGGRSAGRPWSGKGVTLPHGTEVRMKYNGRNHSGRIEDGSWAVEGKSFNSPSAAAGGVALTRAGKHPSLDGWMYWEARLPGESRWVAVSELRRRASS